MSAPGRPKRELRGLRGVIPEVLRGEIGRDPLSPTRPSGLGFARLARVSPGGKARSAKGAPMRRSTLPHRCGNG
jgi:hypothetical protein